MTRLEALILHRRLAVVGCVVSAVTMIFYPVTHSDLLFFAGAILLVVGVVMVTVSTIAIKALLVADPPVNVTVQVAGRNVPVECAYRGFDGNRHTWVVIPPDWFSVIDPVTITAISADVLPPNAAIVYAARVGRR